MAGDDYEMMSTNLTFPSGSMDNATQCFDVMITNDTLMEGDETFIVTMTLRTTELGVTSSITTIRIRIIDDEG